MSKFLPSPFGAPEWILSSLAILFALLGIVLCNFAGLGAGGALFVTVIVGTLLFTAIGGRNRTFFTALFTLTFFGIGVGWSFFGIVADRTPISLNDAVGIPLGWLIMYVLIPVAFAWLVNFVARGIQRLSRKDEQS